MIIDFHCHVGTDISEDPNEFLDFDSLKKSMDQFGIDKSVVFPFSNTDQKMIDDSLTILDKSRTSDWIIPFLRINPNTITDEKLNKLFEIGFAGLKLHPSAQKFEIDEPDFFWIYKLCQEKKIPILFHTEFKTRYANPSKAIKIAKLFPNLTIIIAHFFGNDLSLIREANKYPNVYAEISINSRTFRINQAMNRYNFKNFLFGSDTPYDSQGVPLLKVKESNLSPEDEELIFYKNARKILGI